ncbi:MAG: hypothetical protein KQH53_11495 [Desulfarculaceae bacterium]|nr:hypothetical protein [Desulfarculaceae bacterium]
MDKEQTQAKQGSKAALIAVIAGGILGLYALIAWSTAMFPGGWQMGLAALILLTAPPLIWWLAASRGGRRG